MILGILPVQMSRDLAAFHLTYIELGPICLFQLNCYRMLSWILVVDIAYSMRCEIGLAILITFNFVFVSVEAYCILYKQQDFLGKQGRTKSSRQVQLSKVHPE